MAWSMKKNEKQKIKPKKQEYEDEEEEYSDEESEEEQEEEPEQAPRKIIAQSGRSDFHDIKNKIVEESSATKRKVLVVKELPTREIRVVRLEDGTEAELITIEEALTEILNR